MRWSYCFCSSSWESFGWFYSRILAELTADGVVEPTRSFLLLYLKHLFTMSEHAALNESNKTDVSELGIRDAVEEVEDIVETLEDGDIGLADAKDLRDRANTLLAHIETELEVGEGELNRVEHS